MSRCFGPLALAVVLGVADGGVATAQEPGASSTDAGVRRALGEYPWYDAPNDAARGLRTPRTIEGPDVGELPDVSGPWSILSTLGTILVYGLFAALLIGLLVFLARHLSRIEIPDEEPSRRAVSRRVTREGGLPPGLEPDVGDPWAAALEARRQGNLSRAIVLLFAHLLLLLEQHGRLRLVPGRTGRQLTRSIGDAEARRRVEPTLRLFEAVYYGHRSPTPSQVESAWADAEDLQRLLREEAA